MKQSFLIGDDDRAVKIGLEEDLFLIAGPCVIEDEQTCQDIAAKLVEICGKVGVSFIFKASFDKANRSSIKSYRGPGIEKGLDILAGIASKFNVPIVTDVHESSQAEAVAKVADCLQIPAFLCRQTDLLCACGQTGKPVNVKKGQFMSPDEMTMAVGKIKECGNDRILLTERGTFFGYNRLVNDMTAINAMKAIGCPVVFDATHSTQRPGGLGNKSGGQREMSPHLARAAVAAGSNGLFLEVHTNPQKAKSDAACIMPIEWVEGTLKDCREIFKIVRTK